jgi:hypothetical protein
MSIHAIGTGVRLEVAFTDADGEPADPDTVTLQVKLAGTVTEYTYADDQLTRDGVGVYHFDLTVSGRTHYRWVGTGAVLAAVEGVLDAQRSEFV